MVCAMSCTPPDTHWHTLADNGLHAPISRTGSHCCCKLSMTLHYHTPLARGILDVSPPRPISIRVAAPAGPPFFFS